MTQPLSEIQLLNPGVKRLFLKALRSGEYEQGRLQLRTNEDTYCCLGVLTDLAVKAGIVKWEHSDYGWGVEARLPNGTDYIDTSGLDYKILEWAGLENETGIGGNIFFGGAKEDNLMNCNDEQLLTFEEIADIVEENL
jgi:hypothetical protein